MNSFFHENAILGLHFLVISEKQIWLIIKPTSLFLWLLFLILKDFSDYQQMMSHDMHSEQPLVGWKVTSV